MALAGVFAILVNKILYILFIKIANTPAKATATLS